MKKTLLSHDILFLIVCHQSGKHHFTLLIVT